ncbi:MAG: GDSL-type esterase/lipase family protein [Desulfobacterales bacterium]|nr:GDSL-type esterase/lipase family protein [Desulfobacterales bacterium]
MTGKKALLITVALLLSAVGIYKLFSAGSGTEIRNARPAGRVIVCFGDSLTHGTGAPEGRDYPGQLAKLINRPVINAGIPGDTTATALARLERDVLTRKPGIVLITLGGNDLKNGALRGATFARLKKIVTAIQDQGGLVVVGGIRIPFLDRGYGSGYRELAREVGAVLVPDVLDGIINNPKLMSDRIHPNGDGYAIMARRFAEALQPFL